MAKRAFDIAVVLVTLPLTLPVLAVIAVLVRVKLGAPVLFQQSRPGLGGTSFRLVKFRSMTEERDASGARLPDADRLTMFGRWLRATSLDELPEIWNVLKGEMSLVGPRPLLIEYLALYTPQEARRHEVRPGITGWAQVNGRNALSWQERFRLDVWYVDHQSLGLDLKILALTALKTLRREGISAGDHATMPRFEGTREKNRD